MRVNWGTRKLGSWCQSQLAGRKARPGLSHPTWHSHGTSYWSCFNEGKNVSDRSIFAFHHSSIHKKIYWVPVLCQAPAGCRRYIVKKTFSKHSGSLSTIEQITSSQLGWVWIMSGALYSKRMDLLLEMFIQQEGIQQHSARGDSILQANSSPYALPKRATRHPTVLREHCAFKRGQYPQETIHNPGRIFSFSVCFHSCWWRGALR